MIPHFSSSVAKSIFSASPVTRLMAPTRKMTMPTIGPRTQTSLMRWVAPVRSGNWIMHGQEGPPEKKIIPPTMQEAKTKTSGSTINPPSKIMYLRHADLPGASHDPCFGTGDLKFPVGASGKDRWSRGQVKTQVRKPGEGRFSHVFKSPYDVRELKYLFLFDDEGMHIAREMVKCSTKRGIRVHSKLAPIASLGGEIWFCPKENAVYFNLGSGRYPAKDPVAAEEAVAKFLLSLGYGKVYAVPHGQRYGDITPHLYMLDAGPIHNGHEPGLALR